MATNIRADSGDSTTCASSASDLEDLAGLNYVLGSGPNSGRYTFAINGGDTNAGDEGLILYVDNIKVVYDSETIVSDFE